MLKSSQLLKNINWLLAEKIFRLSVSLFISVFVARYLGPDDLGIWNFILAFIGVVSVFTILGFDVNASKEFIENPQKEQEVFNTLFFLRLSASLFGFLITLLFLPLFGVAGNLSYTILLIISSYFIFQATDVVDYLLQSKMQARRVVTARFWAFAVVSVIKIYLVYGQFSLNYFIFTSVFELIIAAVIFLFYLKNRLKINIQFSDFNRQLAIAFIKKSVIFMAASSMVMLSLRVDQFFIVSYLDASQNGIYSVAIKIFEVSNFIPHVISVSFIPFLASRKQSDAENYLQLIPKMLLVLVPVSLMFFVGNYWLAHVVMEFLYGNNYFGSGAVLQTLGFSFPALFILVILNSYLIVSEQNKHYLISAILALVVNISLNLFLIPSMGISGAAIAYTASLYSSVLYLSILFLNKYLDTKKV